MTQEFDAAQLLTELPNGSVSIFDRELRYLYAAGRGLREVGLTAEALIGKRLDQAFSADAAALVEPQYRRVFDGESLVFGLHYFRRTYALSAAPYKIGGGRVEQIVVVAQDISTLRPPSDVQPVAEHAHDPHDYVIVTLGHELRNPLGAIRAAAAVIERSPNRAARDRARGVIERQVATAEALIEDLSELSRAQRGTLCLHYSAVAVGALILDAVEAAAHLTTGAKHRIHVAHGDTDVILHVDRPRLIRVLANLLSNAIRYSPDGGDIIVGGRVTPDSISLSVTDEGIGLAPDALGRIFELFQREHTSGDGGLGIGLWISREIVEGHGGRIDVFSGGHGQGATFTIRLPLALLATQ